jgi:hopanoid biosynthesis associated radical SAM protein HpnH
MPIPASQMWTVASYVIRQKLKGRKRYPLVVMLEPLYRCNLACAGCGKIQYPGHILKQNLTPEECFHAIDEAGVPIVSIPGGEPLMHPQIQQIIEGLVARRKYVYLCTNALLLKEKLHLFQPSKYLTFSVHMDGEKEHHDLAVAKEGGYDVAIEAIREAVKCGFRVTTNTTLFDGTDSKSVRQFFDDMMDAGVEGMMLSPGYSYEKAPDQQHFLGRERTKAMFRKILSNRSAKWQFNQSPLFLEFLMGKRHLECTPWGMPTYNIFGWQKPCYLMQEGYTDTFQELYDSTDWDKYGYASGNPKCANCMVHSGHEASAVNVTFTPGGLFETVKAMLSSYRDGEAAKQLAQEKPANPLAGTLVNIDLGSAPEAKSTLQGREFTAADLDEGIEEAFDYRGDVTIQLRNGEQLEGYLFDRDMTAAHPNVGGFGAKTGAGSRAKAVPAGKIRVMLKNAPGKKITIDQAEIEKLAFTGRDMADGRSWEAWVKKYAEKKAAGEQDIHLAPEVLD